MSLMRLVNAAAVACAVALTLLLVGLQPTDATAAPHTENVESPPFGLPDQTLQNVTFARALPTSLITVANRGGTGHRSFLVTVFISGGGSFSFQAKENQADITLPLAQSLSITGVSIRCDSFSAAVCQYTVSFVGR